MPGKRQLKLSQLLFSKKPCPSRPEVTPPVPTSSEPALASNLQTSGGPASGGCPSRPEVTPPVPTSSEPPLASNLQTSGGPASGRPRPHPPSSSAADHQSGTKRGARFNFAKWHKAYPWLENHAGEHVTCDPCGTAHGMGFLASEPRLDLSFISRGFKSWPKVPGSFVRHEASSCHKTAVKMLAQARSPNPTQLQLATGKAKAVREARMALDYIFDAMEYLAHQGLPLRCREEASGNLMQLLQTWSKRSPELKKWLERDTQQFLSYQIQNEILELMAHSILRQLAKDARESGAFSVIVDETQDVSREEQVSLCLRYVDAGFAPQELFLGFHSTESTTADALYRIITDTMVRMNLPMEMLRGQCYDGASNMSGKFNGVQQLIKQREPKAVFIHCAAHRMNLATLATELKNALNEASAVIEFVRSSPKRLAIFGHQRDEDATGLRSFSRTRWTCNERSLKSLLDNWTAVIATLTVILSDPTSASDAAAKAHGFRRGMEQFEFYFMVKLGLLLFQLVTPTLTAIQGKQLSVGAVLAKIQLVREATLSQRKDAAFAEFWASCTASAEELELDQPRLRRPVRQPRKLGGGNEHQPTTPEQLHRQQYFAALDNLAAGLKDRFSTGDDTVLQSLESALAGDLGEARRTAAFYGLDEDRLILHIRMLGDMGHHPTTMTEAASLMTTLGDLLPEVAKLVKLGLTAPATSCTAERSFSLLKRLKTYLRSSMSQARLNHAAICATYSQELKTLDRTELVREFVSRSTQRTNLFGAQ